MLRIALLAGSTRRRSVNVALAECIATQARDRGHVAERIDLADHPLPLFNADDEARDGVHPSAHALVDALDGADAVVLVSPEYNGGFTPLLKNTIDWATRVEKKVWARTPVGIACATPGGSGGRRGLSLLRTLLESITVEVVDTEVSVPGVHDALVDGRFVDDANQREVDALLDDLEAAVASEDAAAA